MFQQDLHEIDIAFIGEHEIDEEEEALNVEMEGDSELQEACISFTDAKFHFNKLRIARGYYFVIAVQDIKEELNTKKQNAPSGRGKGRGKVRKNQQSPKGAARGRRGGRATVRAGNQKAPKFGLKCFRCGGPHFSSECKFHGQKRSRNDADDMDTGHLVFTAIAEDGEFAP